MLARVFNNFAPATVMVIGDFMLDTYIRGSINRISPEAPVSVVKVVREDYLAGGAGNVVLNLHALGCYVIAVGRVADDLNGAKLKKSLELEGIDLSLLINQEDYVTPVKSRVIASNQQVIRIDFEETHPLPAKYEKEILTKISDHLDFVSAVAISDYQKGFLTPHLLAEIIRICRERDILVIVDPKGSDFSKYAGATIIKPNLHEAIAAAGIGYETVDLDSTGKRLLEITKAKSIIITRSEKGITLFESNGQRKDFSVQVREVKDVTGAGDTVLATLTCALVNHLDLPEAIQLANISAGIAVERLGCVQVSLSQLAHRVLEYHTENKVFEEGHLFALEHALKDRTVIVITIPNLKSLTPGLFRKLSEFKQLNLDNELVIYIRDENPEEDFLRLLASVSEVDWIVIQGEDFKRFCKRLHPSLIVDLDEVGNILNQNALDISSYI